MRKFRLQQSVRAFWRNRRYLLCFCWCLGLLLGTLFAVGADASFLSLMRQAAVSRVSIVNLLTAIVLPFLFSALAVYMGRPRALYVICFCKALCFAFCIVLADRSFGTAGWLIQPLLLFSDLLLAPVLFWFSVRHIGGGSGSLQKDIGFCAAVIAAVAMLDAFWVSPFLAELFIR